jgi:hypothetical protein
MYADIHPFMILVLSIQGFERMNIASHVYYEVVYASHGQNETEHK